jgi:hypothetical protein
MSTTASAIRVPQLLALLVRCSQHPPVLQIHEAKSTGRRGREDLRIEAWLSGKSLPTALLDLACTPKGPRHRASIQPATDTSGFSVPAVRNHCAHSERLNSSSYTRTKRRIVLASVTIRSVSRCCRRGRGRGR